MWRVAQMITTMVIFIVVMFLLAIPVHFGADVVVRWIIGWGGPFMPLLIMAPFIAAGLTAGIRATLAGRRERRNKRARATE